MSKKNSTGFCPSNLQRRELCPGSLRMEKDLPPDTYTRNQDNIRLHALIDSELALIYGFELSSDSVSVDFESREDAEITKLTIKKLVAIIGSNSILTGYLKKRLKYRYLGCDIYHGRPDVLLNGTDRTIVINWLPGHQDYAESALILRSKAYALAAAQEFPDKIIEIHYFNPFTGQHLKHNFNSISGLAGDIGNIILRCREPNAPLIPGPEQCKFCLAAEQGTCPAFMKTVDMTLNDADDLLPLPSLGHLEEGELCSLYHKCKTISKLLDRVESRIKKQCRENGNCGNLTLKTISGGREIKDINSAFQRLSGSFTTNDFLNFCSLSVSRLEKEYAGKQKELKLTNTEKEAKEKFSAILNDLILYKPDKQMLIDKF